MQEPTFQEISAPSEQQLEKNIRRTWNRNGALLLIMFAAVEFFTYLSVYLLQKHGINQSNPSLYNSLIILCNFVSRYFIVIPLLLLFNRKSCKDTPVKLYQKPHVSGEYLLKWTVIGFSCTYVANLAFNFFFNYLQSLLKIKLYAPNLVLGPSLLDNIITVVFFAFAAPFMEESLFRGSLLQNAKKYGDWFSIIMVAALFGITHMNYQQIFYAMTLGVIAGFLFIKTGSLWPPILVHFGINIFGTIASLCYSHMDSASLRTGSISLRYVETHMGLFCVLILLIVVMFALLISGIVLLLRELIHHPEQFHLSNGCPVLSWKKKLYACLTSPVIVIYLAIALSATVWTAMRG